MSTGLSNLEVGDLYRRYGHLVLRRTRALLRDDQLAEDVLQSVFLKVMMHGASVRTADSQLAWLYRVVDRCCFDLIRRRRREHSIPECVPSPEGRNVSTIEERSVLSMLWEKLDARERAVAMLLYNDGLTQQEVSRRLGWSRQTIGKKVLAIRQAADQLARELELVK